jgi:hypothetical protein
MEFVATRTGILVSVDGAEVVFEHDEHPGFAKGPAFPTPTQIAQARNGLKNLPPERRAALWSEVERLKTEDR